MTDEHASRLNLLLDEEHATKLHEVAERLYLQPGTVARSLLYTALDQVAPDTATITDLLDRIPGAWERAQQGIADADAGRVTDLDRF